MPFYKPYEVTKEFVNIFLEGTIQSPMDGDSERQSFPFLVLDDGYTGRDIKALVRYYKRSGESAVEDFQEYYPCIVIQNFMPEIDKSRVWGKGTVEGAINEIEGTTELISLPIPLKYRYQVSAVTKRQSDIEAIFAWFLERFTYEVGGDCLELNKIVSPEHGIIADIVPYTFNFHEVERMNDKRFEYVFTFTLMPWVHLRKPKNLPYICDILVSLQQQGISGATNTFVEKFNINLFEQ